MPGILFLSWDPKMIWSFSNATNEVFSSATISEQVDKLLLQCFYFFSFSLKVTDFINFQH